MPASSDEQMALYLRHLIEEWLRETGRPASDLAKLAKVTPATISTLRAGKRGVGMKSIAGLGRVFGKTLGDIEKDAPAFVEAHGEGLRQTERRVEYDASPQTARGAVIGWDEAEKIARELYAGTPDEAWVGARGLSGFDFPDEATPEFVWQLAMDWLRVKRLRDAARKRGAQL